MGLDVYLYLYANYDVAAATSAAFDEAVDALYGAAEADPDDEPNSDVRDRVRAELRRKVALLRADFGIGANERPEGVRSIEEPSAKHPDHLFKIGYFRSSYNRGGVNEFLRSFGLPDLYAIFAIDQSPEYHIRNIDWAACRDRAADAIAALIAMRDQPELLVRSEFLSGFGDSVSSEDAIRVAMDAIRDRIKNRAGSSFGGSYSSSEGHFFLDNPLQVVAVIPSATGRYPFEGAGAHVVYRVSPETIDWYQHALEIVVETCEYVLANPPPEGGEYVLHWSS